MKSVGLSTILFLMVFTKNALSFSVREVQSANLEAKKVYNLIRTIGPDFTDKTRVQFNGEEVTLRRIDDNELFFNATVPDEGLV